MARSNDALKRMRSKNRAQVALVVRTHDQVSRQQVAETTGLSMPCVCAIVDELLAEGILVEKGIVAGYRGRPTTMLGINPDGPCVAGIWLSSESIQIIVASPKLEILARKIIPYEMTDEPVNDTVLSIAQGIERCAEMARKSISSFSGVGVAVAGITNSLIGVINFMLNRPGWEGVPIGHLLEEKLGLPVYAENDMRCAALTAEWFVDDRCSSMALYMLICEGIGAAVVQNRELMRGAHDVSCLLGRMTVEPNGPQCACGNRGCLEAVASDIAFLQYIWTEHTIGSRMTSAKRIELVKKGVRMALSGDSKAYNALAKVARYIGLAVANTITVIDPKRVYIGGTLVDAAQDLFLSMIREEVVSRTYPQASSTIEIRPYRNYEEFLLRGSAGLALWQPFRILEEREITLLSEEMRQAKRVSSRLSEESA